MKKLKESDNVKNIAEAQKKRTIARDIAFLKPLLKDVKDEPITFSELEPKIKTHNFKGAVIIKSDKNIFKHVSILALTRYYNRHTTYKIVPLDTLIDRWFTDMNSDLAYQKIELWNVDVLILTGKGILDRNVGPLPRVLIEVIETRKNSGKNTWIFIHSSDDTMIYDNSNLSLSEYVDRVYDYRSKGDNK